MNAVELTEAEREQFAANLRQNLGYAISPIIADAMCGHVEAILAALLAPVEAERDRAVKDCCSCHAVARHERDEARANRDRLAHENAALRRQVAEVQAERREAEYHIQQITEARDRAERTAEAAEPKVAALTAQRDRWEETAGEMTASYLNANAEVTALRAICDAKEPHRTAALAEQCATEWRARAEAAEQTVADLTAEREATVRPVWSERPRTAADSGLVGDDSPVREIVGWEEVDRISAAAVAREHLRMTDRLAAAERGLAARDERHDDRCESEYEPGANAWTPCGCFASRSEAEGLVNRAEAAERALAAGLTLAEQWRGRHDLVMTGDSAAHDLAAALVCTPPLFSSTAPSENSEPVVLTDGPAPQPKRFDPATLNHGTCPKCREWKFIGHGPLCVDCFTAPPATDAEEAQA